MEGGVQLLPKDGEYARFDGEEREYREREERGRGGRGDRMDGEEYNPYGKVGGGRERVYV